MQASGRFTKLVVVTRKTMLEELVERHGTRGQARFLAENRGESFAEVEQAHEAYEDARQALRKALPTGIRCQWIERGFLPNFLFGPHDLVVTLGPDGLVVNVAKYLATQPVLALGPGRFAGNSSEGPTRGAIVTMLNASPPKSTFADTV